MRMILEGESQIRLEMSGEGFEITSEDISISPYHLLAGSLASCIALVMVPWAERSGLDLEPLTISIGWERASERHNQVRRMSVALRWPWASGRAAGGGRAPRQGRSNSCNVGFGNRDHE